MYTCIHAHKRTYAQTHTRTNAHAYTQTDKHSIVFHSIPHSILCHYMTLHDMTRHYITLDYISRHYITFVHALKMQCTLPVCTAASVGVTYSAHVAPRS